MFVNHPTPIQYFLTLIGISLGANVENDLANYYLFFIAYGVQCSVLLVQDAILFLLPSSCFEVASLMILCMIF